MVARSVLDMEYGTANKHHALTLLLDIGFCAFFSRSALSKRFSILLF